MSPDMILLSLVIVPLVGSLLITRLDKVPNIREAVTLFTSGILLTIALYVYFNREIFTGLEIVLAEPFAGMSVALSLESLGLIYILVASSLWLVTSIYAIGYMRAHKEQNQTRFFSLFAVSIASVMAIAMADNLFTLFLFYEALTLLTYPLVTHAGSDRARKNGRLYLGILMGSSIAFFLPAMAIVWFSAGTLDFTQGGILAGKLDAHWAFPVFLLFILGIGKAAVMPMHKWLPAAMVAPTPVSALLHAVAVVKAGVFAVIKVTMFVFGTDYLTETGGHHLLVWLPAITILLASFIAMTRDNLKERLAYSTISQLSYIVLGALLANSMGLLGASMHIVMHAFAKISLFFAAGAILITTHKTRVSELAGLGRQMPVTFGVFMIGTMSIIGFPPFGGLWSKWYLALGTLDFTGPDFTKWVLLGTLILSSLLNIVYLMVIPVKAFFQKPEEGEITGVKEAPLPCLIGLLIPALICLILFFMPEPLFDLAQSATMIGG